jgi:hypothetical protein
VSLPSCFPALWDEVQTSSLGQLGDHTDADCPSAVIALTHRGLAFFLGFVHA